MVFDSYNSNTVVKSGMQESVDDKHPIKIHDKYIC